MLVHDTEIEGKEMHDSEIEGKEMHGGENEGNEMHGKKIKGRKIKVIRGAVAVAATTRRVGGPKVFVPDAKGWRRNL